MDTIAQQKHTNSGVWNVRTKLTNAYGSTGCTWSGQTVGGDVHPGNK